MRLQRQHRNNEIVTILRRSTVTKPCHVGSWCCGEVRTADAAVGLRFFLEALRLGRCSVTASISGGGRDHLVANVVYEERTPNCRIRRGDPTERHGLVRPKRPYGKKGVVDAEPSTTVKRPHPLVSIVSHGPSSGPAPTAERPPRVAGRGDGPTCRVPLAAEPRPGDGL